jgi:hypothetical protein
VATPAAAVAGRCTGDCAGDGPSKATVKASSDGLKPWPHCVQDNRFSELDAPQLGQTISGYLRDRHGKSVK